MKYYLEYDQSSTLLIVNRAKSRRQEGLFFTILQGFLAQCGLYAAGGELFASPVKETSLLFSMIFAQHKRLIELEKRLNETLK